MVNIANWLEASAIARTDEPAIFHGERPVLSYGAFARTAAAIGGNLSRLHGVKPGERVALLMNNALEFLLAFYGTLWMGGATVPISAKLHGREAGWIIENAEARLVIADMACAEALRADCTVPIVIIGSPDWERLIKATDLDAPFPRSDDDLAWIFYTSGTTGRPKGAMLSHGNLVAMSLSYLADVDLVGSGDAILYAAPMSHGAGLYNMIFTRMGARHVVPASGKFDPAEILRLAATLRDVSFFAAPTMVRRLVEAAAEAGEDGDGIKTIVYGGGPMYLADIERALSVMGQRFVQIYGQGESPMTITCLSRVDHARGDKRRLATVGRAHSPVEVRIARADGSPASPGEPGEILVRGMTVMQGYLGDPAATAGALKDGWLVTGDIGRLDAGGYLTLTDRSKDVIISGGSNIYPREIEEVLLTHPGVSEVSVIGVADQEWGEIVVACVVCDETISDTEFNSHCNRHLGRFKSPKRYVRMKALPKNNYGKVLKTELRKIASGQVTAAPSA